MLCLSLLADASAGEAADLELKNLKQGQVINGFRTDALYINDSDKAFGARFKHERTGFTLDLLQIESVPQAFIWANTVLNTDSGVAHTQEHLLLGKGNKGRSHGTITQMSLVEDSAGTDQWRTYYHFNTSAGKNIFFNLTEHYLDLLLHPDYTDEEIRREVCHFNIREDSKTKLLSLEEKGTVYNEMQSSARAPHSVLWFAMTNLLYGKGHPLACVNGGTPEGIRKLTPQEIRKFHKKNYVLHNMGMIASLSREIAPAEFLQQLDAALGRLQKQPSYFASLKSSDIPVFPAPKPPFAPGKIQIISFQDRNSQKPGSVNFVWPAFLNLSLKERMLLQYFLTNFAGDADTPLYKIFVDSRTIKIDSGATGVSAWAYDAQGCPITIGIDDVSQSHINNKDILHYRKIVIDELTRIANWKDGAPQLKAFNTKLMATLAQDRRYYSDFVNKPPSFGSRGYAGSFMKQLLRLERQGGFRRVVTLKPELDQIEIILKDKSNIWKKYLSKWKLLDTVPYAIASRPDPSLIAKEEKETKARLEAETKLLQKEYNAKNNQEALQKYKSEYDKKTEELDALAANDAKNRKFIDSPPLSPDEQLNYTITSVGKVPVLSSTFDSMTSSNTILALRLDSVAPADLAYLYMLPSLLTGTGVINKGKVITYEQMAERLRQEIFYLQPHISANPDTGRYELKLNAAGSNPKESRRAIEWMMLVLHSPYWQKDNLPRIRDLVEQTLSGLRKRRESGYEEHWVHTFEAGYRRQSLPLLLHTKCFLTQAYNVQRLKWRLKNSVSPESLKCFLDFMSKLSELGAKQSRTNLQNLLSVLDNQAAAAVSLASELSDLTAAFAKLPADAKNLVSDAAADLSQDLADIPDSYLSKDWTSLCSDIIWDIQVDPEKILKDLNRVRENLLLKTGARLALIGSKSSQEALAEPINSLIASLGDQEFKPVKYSDEKVITRRLQERFGEPVQPLFIGLVNPNTHQGVVINTAPSIKYKDTDDESLLNAISIDLFSGAGAHSLFMKTWGAGLAYGNGPSWSPQTRICYYADKMPSMAETLSFVATQLKKAKPEPGLADYAISQNFHSRASQDFSARGEMMSDDYADGTTPDVVRTFRKAILNLRKKPDLEKQLFARMLKEYGKVIPGLGVKAKDVPEGVFSSIADEKQLGLYEDFLKTTEGPDTKVYQLWARDFWVSADSNNAL